MRFLRYSIKAGIANILVKKPDRHEFFTKDVFAGMKFAVAPMLDPPIIALTSTQAPKILIKFPLLNCFAIKRDECVLSVTLLAFDEKELFKLFYSFTLQSVTNFDQDVNSSVAYFYFFPSAEFS